MKCSWTKDLRLVPGQVPRIVLRQRLRIAPIVRRQAKVRFIGGLGW